MSMLSGHSFFPNLFHLNSLQQRQAGVCSQQIKPESLLYELIVCRDHPVDSIRCTKTFSSQPPANLILG